MTVHKITLMEAYLIEILRSNGISNDEIIAKVKTGNVANWQELHKQFDFNELLTFAMKDIDQFEEILNQGYQVKFVTFNGLKNLLRMRFDKEEDKDYERVEKGITNLALNQEELTRLKQMLSGNWVIEIVKKADENVVNITLHSVKHVQEKRNI